MRLIKLIVPAAMIALLALFASHADAQTMGEYATTVGVASGGATSMGTSIGSSVSNSTDDLGGGSRTWGASSLGGSFDERAGAASGSGLGQDFRSACRRVIKRIGVGIALACVTVWQRRVVEQVRRFLRQFIR